MKWRTYDKRNEPLIIVPKFLNPTLYSRIKKGLHYFKLAENQKYCSQMKETLMNWLRKGTEIFYQITMNGRLQALFQLSRDFFICFFLNLLLGYRWFQFLSSWKNPPKTTQSMHSNYLLKKLKCSWKIELWKKTLNKLLNKVDDKK